MSRSSSGASNAAARTWPSRTRGFAWSRIAASTLRAEQRLGLAHEELVERVLARDEHGEAVLAPAGAAPLLAQARDRAREADRDRAVEQADVDSELERVRGGHAQELALDEAALDLAPLRGRVARAVGREPRGELGARRSPRSGG